jgi:hypothetical protein
MENLKTNIVVTSEQLPEEANCILLKKEDIKKAVYFGDCNDTFKLKDELSEIEVNIINEIYLLIIDNEYQTNTSSIDIINKIFDLLGLDNECTYVDYYEEINDNEETYILYDNNGLEYCCLSTYDSDYIYTYWDGHNHKTLELNDIDEDNINFNDNDITWVNIETWDGNNWKWQSRFNHARIGKWKNTYLLKEWDQYQGTHTHIEEISNIDTWIEDNKEYLDKEDIEKIKDL